MLHAVTIVARGEGSEAEMGKEEAEISEETNYASQIPNGAYQSKLCSLCYLLFKSPTSAAF